ncbi:VOC family protein [Paenibacillus sp. GD4]|uniref:VOC family protein n=1 Tax=Paenibacillus sp. GD4 TaxID=3068890 RepID=UPI002796D161|nr:VOC family protein [Paenibacillus sp. GD4]MDQ1909690.1 VOC family protein [Paenibacillus sp. GD4]
MHIQQIGSVFITVSNLERSVLFYTETLGLTCRGIEDWGDGKRGATLFFNPHPPNAALLTLAEQQGEFDSQRKSSFNFKCKNAPEFYESLQSKGCRVTALETWNSPWNHHVMFDLYDPDDNKINVIEMVPVIAK